MKKIFKNTPLEGSRIDQSTTPDWWKKVRNIATSLATAAWVGYGLQEQMPDVVPEVIFEWIKVVAIVATAVAGTAAVTKK